MTDSFQQLISGKQQGVTASLLRGFLWLLSCFYSLVIRLRNWLFNSGIKKSFTSDAAAISVGNITTGGTGKTPVVAFLTNWFTERGVNVAILSRGYKSLDSGENDEKLVLDRLSPGVPHLQNPDRIQSAKRASAEYESQVLVMDDAFQHRRIARNLDLVLIDSTNPWGFGHLLPRGLLREPKSGLRRADMILITRSDQVETASLERQRAEIAETAPEVPLIVTRFSATGWRTLTGEKLPLDAFADQKTIAFCGIGNPDGFRKSLETVGVLPEELRAFPDHHHYDASDVGELLAAAQQQQATVLVTTLKDLVKIPADQDSKITIAALEIELEILSGAEHLEERLNSILQTSQE